MGIVDNSERKERMFLLKQETTLAHPHCESDCGREQMQATTSAVSSRGCSGGSVAPDWWFQHFEPMWGPFIHGFRCQKNVTLPEFERAASQVPGLTPIEKIIAISVFRQQQEQGVAPSPTTSAFRSERRLSAV